MSLNISKLIEVAEKITTDDQIGMAETITVPVQDFQFGGKSYQLQLVLTSNKNHIVDNLYE